MRVTLAAPILRAVMAAALLAACALAPATAQQAQPTARDPSEQRYMDALHSMSEGRSGEASDALSRLIEEAPQHAGAWLDLALLQCERGMKEDAERLFRAIEERFSPPPGIAEIIANARARGCTGPEIRQQFSLRISRGYDSNVNQGATNPFFSIGSGSTRIDLELMPEFRPQSDRYTLAGGEYLRELETANLSAFAQLRLRANDTLSRYDTGSARFGLERPWKLGEWNIRTMLAADFLSLGGHLYQRQLQLQSRATPPWQLPEGMQLHLFAGLARVDYPTLSNFDAHNAELNAMLVGQHGRLSSQFSLGLLHDRGAARRPGGDRSGVYASMQAQYRIAPGLRGELGWALQSWRSDAVYSPKVIEQMRRQNTRLVNAGLAWSPAPQQELQLELRQVRNNENISIFQYNSRLLQLSWQWFGL